MFYISSDAVIWTNGMKDKQDNKHFFLDSFLY